MKLHQLIKRYLQIQTSQLVYQDVKRFRYARCRHIVAFYYCFVCFCSSDNIVGFYGQYFLQNVRCTESLQCPNLHFSKSLSSELCFTSKRLLCDYRVWSYTSCVHLVVYHVVQFQHIYIADCCRLVKDLSCFTISQITFSTTSQAYCSTH